jgi:chromate transport protein ChrA
VILGIIVVKYGSLAANTGIIRGIAPAVMGILIAVVIKMCQDQVRNKWGYLAVLVVFALIFLLKINPVFLILTSVIIAVVCRFLYKGGKDNAA